MAGLYAADGSWNVTVVDGSLAVGFYADDGSMNVIISDGSPGPLYDPCGAIRVTLVAADSRRYAADGSLNVCESPYVNGPLHVTAVGGSFGASIQLSGTHQVAEDIALNGDVGTLSVINGSGSYTFTITSDPDSKFALNVDGVTLEVDAALDYETDTDHQVTIEADNGVDPVISRTFTINVSNVVVEAVTFDPATKGADVVLSGGNLIATASSPTGAQTAQSTVSYSTGQYYCEFTMTAFAPGSGVVGVVGSTWVPGDLTYFGEDHSKGQSIWSDGSVSDGAVYGVGDMPTFAAGDVISLAVDVGAAKMWWRINGGVWLPNGHPQSGAGGFDISEVTLPLFAATEMDEDTDATTVNFGASAYAQNPPLGYLNWDGTDAGGTDVFGFDPDNKHASITLSNSNLTATGDGVANPSVVLATTSKTTGKYYYEVSLASGGGGYPAVGIANTSLNAVGGVEYLDDVIGVGYWYDGYLQGAGNAEAYTYGDTVCVAVDIDAELMWVRKNGGDWKPSGHPADSSGGSDVSSLTAPLSPAVEFDVNADILTANFGASAYAQNPPLDYLNWDGTDAGGTDVPAGSTAGTPIGLLLTLTYAS